MDVDEEKYRRESVRKSAELPGSGGVE